jgi:hypothetical protein
MRPPEPNRKGHESDSVRTGGHPIFLAPRFVTGSPSSGPHHTRCLPVLAKGRNSRRETIWPQRSKPRREPPRFSERGRRRHVDGNDPEGRDP